jgi:transcriptional regulator with XRE-family HTH domain
MAYRKNRGRIESLGMRLAYLREMENLTQIELALKIGYSESMIRKWEKDEHCPRADVICEYSDLFNVSADWILFGNDSTTNKRAIPTP